MHSLTDRKIHSVQVRSRRTERACSRYRMPAVVADRGTVQAITSLAMAPKPRLNFLTTLSGAERAGVGRSCPC